MNIRLTPFIKDCLPLAISWAFKEENADFFRRFPPIQDWCEDVKALQVFSQFYLIWDEDKAIGLTGLVNNDPYGRNIEFCILLDQDYVIDRREAMCLTFDQMSDYVFNYMNYNKITCRILSYRKGLGEGLEIQGWECEGDLRQNIFYKGEWRDEKLFALLSSDWRKR